MALRVVTDGTPAFVDGKLDLGGGREIDRIQGFEMRCHMKCETTSSRPHAARLRFVRDASQQSAGDQLADSMMFGPDGRAQKNVFKLKVFIIDDVRKGKAALVATIDFGKAIIRGVAEPKELDDRKQIIEVLGSDWQYINAATNKSQPEDKTLVPVCTDGFDVRI